MALEIFGEMYNKTFNPDNATRSTDNKQRKVIQHSSHNNRKPVPKPSNKKMEEVQPKFNKEFLKFEREGFLDFYKDGKKVVGKLTFIMSDPIIDDEINDDIHTEVFTDNNTGLKIRIITSKSEDTTEMDIIELPKNALNDFNQMILVWEPYERNTNIDPNNNIESITTSFDNDDLYTIEDLEEQLREKEHEMWNNYNDYDEALDIVNTSHMEGILDAYIKEYIKSDDELSYYESIKDKVDPDIILWEINCHVGTDSSKTYTLIGKNKRPILIGKELVYRRSFRLKNKMLGVRLYQNGGKYFLYHVPDSKDYWIEIIKEDDKEPLDTPDNFILFESNMSLIMDMLDESNISKEEETE